MDEYKIFAGGRFITTDKELKVINPYNGDVVGRTFLGSEKELETAISTAQSAQKTMRVLPSYSRYEALMKIATMLKAEREEFSRILCLESAKPIRYAIAEVDRSIQTFTVAAEEAKRLPKEYISLDWTPSGKAKEGLIKYFPVGLVAGISPFNFPLNLAVHKIAPAIASGCPIILKPSSTTPLSTLKLAQIISKTDLPDGVVSVIPMDRKTGNRLVTDERFKLLTFTGSPEVGWIMKREAGRKKVLLELGGNAAVLVTESADIESAVAKCLISGFSYSGQVCIHAQRLFVHEKVFSVFSEKFIEGVKRLIVGNPLDPETEISAMIDEENAIRVEQWVNEAKKGGAKVLCGGQREKGFYSPTVITETNRNMKVCSMEVFGPVVTLESYSDFEKVIDVINDSRYGLQAGVFTNDIRQQDLAFELLEVGGVILNDVPSFRVDHMPYGGIKESGLGREGVKYAILEMMEPKIMVKNFR
jgi:acyl-CoA reductase-like NAD-dependent aldehyde dehydrogenase